MVMVVMIPIKTILRKSLEKQRSSTLIQTLTVGMILIISNIAETNPIGEAVLINLIIEEEATREVVLAKEGIVMKETNLISILLIVKTLMIITLVHL